MPIQTYDRGSAVLLPDGSTVTQIGTTMNKWVESFSGAAYAAGAASITALTDATGNWDMVRTPTGMTITRNNGNLTIAMGTTAADELLLVGRNTVTIPQNLVVTGTISQRISTNEIRFGLLEVDANGTPVANANYSGFFRNMASILLTGTVGGNATGEALEDNIAALKQAAFNLASSSNTINDYSLESRPEDITYSSQSGDSATARSSNGARLSSVVPNPTKLYRPFIWLKNLTTPASSTTVTLNRVVSMDVQEVQAEIGGGRGNFMGSQAIPIIPVSGGGTVPVTQTTAANMMTTVGNAVASTTSNSAAPHKLISAASTNGTNIKSTAGKIVGGTFANTTASWKYVKLFNKNSTPSVGTDTPFLTLPIAPNDHLDIAAVSDMYGIYFSSGISYGITGAVADLDTTTVAAGDVVVALLYV